MDIQAVWMDISECREGWYAEKNLCSPVAWYMFTMIYDDFKLLFWESCTYSVKVIIMDLCFWIQKKWANNFDWISFILTRKLFGIFTLSQYDEKLPALCQLPICFHVNWATSEGGEGLHIVNWEKPNSFYYACPGSGWSKCLLWL